MNWFGSGFVTIIIYQLGLGTINLNQNNLITESGLDILTENGMTLLIEPI